MAEKEKLWFLIKHSWIEWLEDLSMEQRGEFFTALYTGEVPKGIAGAFVKNNIEEFHRVNAYKEKISKKNQSNGIQGGAPKGNANAKKTTQNQPTNNPNTADLQPTNNLIDIDTDKDIDTKIGLDKVKDNKIKERDIKKEKEEDIDKMFLELFGDYQHNLSKTE